jgi:hypothetical protein
MNDPFLDHLIQAQREGSPQTIGVLLDGTVLIGVLASPKSFVDATAEITDKNLDAAVKSSISSGSDPDDAREVGNKFRSAWTLDPALERADALDEWITLRDVTMWTGGRQVDPVLAVRVRLDAIEGWWVAEGK